MWSSIGIVVSPSFFATVQSAGAGGYGVGAVHGVVQVVGGTVAFSALGSLALSMAATEGI